MFTAVFLVSVVVAVLQSCSGQCPVWTTYSNTTGKCECGDSLKGVVDCSPGTLQVSVMKCYCMTYNEEANSTVVGPCIFTCVGLNKTKPHFNRVVAHNIYELNNDSCGMFYRTGQLCSQCLAGYGLPVYSYQSLACTKCLRSEFRLNLLKYLCVAFLPLTVFYTIVIILKLSITSGRLVVYVLLCQLATAPLATKFMIG